MDTSIIKIKKAVRGLQIEDAVLTPEGYILHAKSLCGRIYKFLIKDKESFVYLGGKWRNLPERISEIIVYEFYTTKALSII